MFRFVMMEFVRVLATFLVVMLIFFLLSLTKVEAQETFCAPRGVITKKLTEDYGEAQVAIGIAKGGTLLEVWSNLANGSWTILSTSTAGITCAVQSGENFHYTLTNTPEGELN